jgi:polar amino acid transport system permease protein
MSAGPPKQRSVASELPYWLFVLIAAAVAVLVALFLSETHRPIVFAVFDGVIVTVRVTIIAFALSLVLGTIVALGLVSHRRWLRESVTAYVEVMRGVPMLVLLYYIAFAVGPAIINGYNAAFGPIIQLGLLPAITLRDFGFEWRAIFALTLGYSAFIAEVVRGGIESIPRGQTEAAQALGLTRFQVLRLIVLPQAFKNMLPPLGNDLVSMLKDSSLVSALGVSDITQIGKTYSAATFLFFETYTVVAIYYLIMTIGLSLLVRRLEQRMRRNEKR